MDLRLAFNPGPANCREGLQVRLAYHPEGSRTLMSIMPNLTQALSNAENEHSGTTAFGKQKGLEDIADIRPALLVSFAYLNGFLKHRSRYWFRDWVLDSGAFSAWKSGRHVELQTYIDKAKELMESDGQLVEIYALDVIGDWKTSKANCDEMWRQGVPAIPCFHVGEPWDVLINLANDYPKIALGGAVGYRRKDDWAEQCFARVWPKLIHGFGYGSEESIMRVPWHSTDATNWEIGPCGYGRWAKFGKLSVHGSNQNLRSQILYYLDLESRARLRWARELQQLQRLTPYSIRLGGMFGGRVDAKAMAFDPRPTATGENDVR